ESTLLGILNPTFINYPEVMLRPPPWLSPPPFIARRQARSAAGLFPKQGRLGGQWHRRQCQFRLDWDEFLGWSQGCDHARQACHAPPHWTGMAREYSQDRRDFGDRGSRRVLRRHGRKSSRRCTSKP